MEMKTCLNKKILNQLIVIKESKLNNIHFLNKNKLIFKKILQKQLFNILLEKEIIL